MIVQEFTLEKYGWRIKVYYSIRSYNLETIAEDLRTLGSSEGDIEEILDDLSKEKLNAGCIFSNLYTKKSIIIIGPTSSAEEFQDTFDHEKGHLAMHISIAEGIDPFSEEYQYLTGDIGQAMFKVGKMFLCEHCRPALYE